MVFLGLPGEKPMMPPPPKVCPPIPEEEPPKDDVLKEPEDEPEDELPPEELESVPPVLPPEVSVGLPFAPGVPLLGLDGLDGSLELPDAPDPPAVLEESVGQPPMGVLVPIPMDELRPEEPKLDELRLEELGLEELKLELLESGEPRPEELSPLMPQFAPMPPINWLAMGLPKKPKAVGCFCSPMWMGFHSSFPVEGSMYFLRRKRI